jgi:hypothetical protein
MTFPARQLWVSEHSCQLRGAPAESTGLEVEPIPPLSVRTGRFTHEDVLVTNRAAHEQVLLTAGDLTSAATDSSGSVAVGIRFQERHLRDTFGASYDDYAAHVPALLPRLPLRRRSLHSPALSRRAMGPRTATAESVRTEIAEDTR